MCVCVCVCVYLFIYLLLVSYRPFHEAVGASGFPVVYSRPLVRSTGPSFRSGSTMADLFALWFPTSTMAGFFELPFPASTMTDSP